VRVRIGPVRIDGLRSGAVRQLKAPEIRGLGAGAGTSRAATGGGRSRPGPREATRPREAPRPRERPGPREAPRPREAR